MLCYLSLELYVDLLQIIKIHIVNARKVYFGYLFEADIVCDKVTKHIL